MRGGDTDLELYTMDADGTNQMLLNADSVQDVSPWWSPDGTLILYNPFGTGNDEITGLRTRPTCPGGRG